MASVKDKKPFIKYSVSVGVAQSPPVAILLYKRKTRISERERNKEFRRDIVLGRCCSGRNRNQLGKMIKMLYKHWKHGMGWVLEPCNFR